ncbi:DNA replication and repair protein RecN [endosymbiont of Ridgeia piscesae]|jgi:DNA repair protein RecN (Recombination protein N)|uniref:DNA repair protein RecN n=2 Tax=endosymbiont of Ridgeia piscesae TaxID=54398 RepID=A0A0T5YZ26_9GAMM|nr:DNA repair protein RecN [endosymbiont of Ridgeia piscesae]KRT55518.1 DNA replication and repair protein RecN [endosymbiont of Ridgeia piscesae]
MLIQIHIKDLAIVSSLELQLRPGLTAMTGETGAGKSILIDALGMALGERSDAGMVRAGCERAEVSALFDISQLPQVHSWLQEQSLEDGDDCLVRRVVSAEGRSRAYINGHPSPLSQLRSLGGLLVEIHGQHAHQLLLQNNHQRTLLDGYGQHQEESLQVAAHFNSYRRLRDELAKRKSEESERSSRLDLLRFQSAELEALALSNDELELLQQDHNRLANLERLRNSCGTILTQLDEAEPSVRSQLARFADELAELSGLDANLIDAAETIASALIQVDEGVTALRGYLDDLDLDPESLQQVEQRLGAIHDTARKYRVRPEALVERQQSIQQELQTTENAGEALEQLEQQVREQRERYFEAAYRLSKKRRQSGKRLAAEISQAMRQLGMTGGRFDVELAPLEADDAGASGLERVEFMVSANPGMPLAPLNKVASGGELSRISLAIQVATSSCTETPTLVFDEVDVGIGGGVAEIVGQMLRRLGSSLQVLCVTHLPQVASQANQHLQVRKQSDRKSTRTDITPLSPNQRIQEIARMLGGVEITPQTLAHAEEMVRQASEAETGIVIGAAE